MRRCICICFVLVIIHTIYAEIILPDQRTIWSPGIPGGIPQTSKPVESVIAYGADSTGLKDCKDAIISAINALPDNGGVVYFPGGTYRIKSTITVGKNSVVFRGDGSDKTRLLHDHTGICFDVITYKRGSWQIMSSGYSKGSREVIVEDGSKFREGAFAEVQQKNDSSLMYTSKEWNQSWAESAVGQLFEITSVNKNVVTFRTPFHVTFKSDMQPRIRPQGFVTGVGFESFYIERLQSESHTFQFKNAAYCWIKNVESYHTRKSHVTNNTTLGCEYRDSYFHHSFSYGGGGSGYGVEFGYHSTDGLCENNIFDSLRHAMMVHVGANGCVFGYNYSLNPVQGDGETNLNVGWVPPDISLHGHYAQVNLFESNVVQEVGVGDYWGPMGPYNTFLRNVIQGEGVFLYDYSHRQNFIGNISTSWKDDGTSSGTLKHGENINGVVIWDSSIIDRTIPSSYYLKSKPEFYGIMEWPSLGEDRHDGTIPAWERWKSGMANSINHEKKLKIDSKFDIVKDFRNKTIILNVTSKAFKKINAAIYDLNGKKIQIDMHRFRTDNNNYIRLEYENLSNGIYIFCVNNNVISERIKIMMW